VLRGQVRKTMENVSELMSGGPDAASFRPLQACSRCGRSFLVFPRILWFCRMFAQ